ncbi:acetate kinase [Microcoleus sp. FACHB-1515]|uniref:acetate/propionate family kinase n=1 Tax=Cyanophyceae TaxID=3028117 RepID=UPI001681E348|nr:acetate kinase [Microcoleus sp. FACHB-1515]MBD2088621.1 acetate kinase [Microcoleus sp. FACHB-1515]
MKILILNAGSSSQKSCLYDIDALPDLPPEPLWEGSIDWTHQQGVAELKVKAKGKSIDRQIETIDRTVATEELLKTIWSGETQVISDPSAIDRVGHRVVHGGAEYQQPTRVTAEVKAAIDRLAALAPAHNPANLDGIEAIEQLLGDVPQIAVFDTAFHSQMPASAATYPISQEWIDRGIRRYGFHGISHQYCAERAAQLLGRSSELQLITCHLGNGCSLAAIRDGHSIDTTMGFTPIDGLMMGTRSGSVDPGILIHLLREGLTIDDLDRLLNKESGLKGVSGVSGDMRSIAQAIEQGNDRAKLAFEVYVHRLRSNIGAMLASLGGLDAIVFTAGVGENSAAVRTEACAAFEWLGWKIDAAKNRVKSADDRDIAAADSSVRILVIHTQEDWAIAQACWNLNI